MTKLEGKRPYFFPICFFEHFPMSTGLSPCPRTPWGVTKAQATLFHNLKKRRQASNLIQDQILEMLTKLDILITIDHNSPTERHIVFLIHLPVSAQLSTSYPFWSWFTQLWIIYLGYVIHIYRFHTWVTYWGSNVHKQRICWNKKIAEKLNILYTLSWTGFIQINVNAITFRLSICSRLHWGSLSTWEGKSRVRLRLWWETGRGRRFQQILVVGRATTWSWWLTTFSPLWQMGAALIFSRGWWWVDLHKTSWRCFQHSNSFSACIIISSSQHHTSCRAFSFILDPLLRTRGESQQPDLLIFVSPFEPDLKGLDWVSRMIPTNKSSVFPAERDLAMISGSEE